MHKRGIAATSPELLRADKRHQMSTTMATVSNMTVADLIILLKENVSHLATKDDMVALGHEVSVLRANQEECVAKITYLEAQNARLESEVERLIKKETEGNLLVHLPSEESKTLISKAKDVCSGLLEAEFAGAVKDAYQVKCNKFGMSNVVVQMAHRSAANNVLKNCRKLKGTRMSVHKDLPYIVRQKRRCLGQIQAAIKLKMPNIKSYLRDDRMEIDGSFFTWDNNLGLRCGNSDGFSILSEKYKILSGLRSQFKQNKNTTHVNETSTSVGVNGSAAVNNNPFDAPAPSAREHIRSVEGGSPQ